MTDFLAFTIVGIVTGCIYAVAASGLVVTYTTSGIFNFAHGAIGMFCAFAYWQLRVDAGWPAPLALVAVICGLAPAMGAVIERILMRKLHGTPTGVSLVVTLALLVFLLGLAQTIWPPQEARRVDPFFAGRGVKLAGVVVSYHEITVLIVAVAIAASLRLLLFHTRMGVTMRAVVDDRELAGLNGAYPERVAQLSWALGAALAAVAGILIAPTLSLNHLNLTTLVIYGYAAAVLGRLRSLPLTFVGAMILGLLNSYTIGYGSSVTFLGDLKQALPTIFLFGVLVFLPQARLRAGRPTGARAPRVPSGREALAAAVGFVAVMTVLSAVLSEFWLFNVASSLVVGIVLLSLVLLSGYGGQVSLMQMSFVGVGALAMGRLAGGGSPAGLLAAAGLAAAFGALVAVPALRLQDLYLALTTLAFALFGEWAFNQRWLFDQGGLLAVHRLQLPGVAFTSERSQLVLAAVAFSLVGLLVLAIRRGPYGRRLAAMRDSPVACATLGMNLIATKTAAFAVSAAIAGVAGALYGGLRTSVSAPDFAMLQSLFIFLVASFGGINTVTGAALGGAFLALVPELQSRVGVDNLQFFGIALGAIALANQPNGLGGAVADAGERLREALARLRRRPVAVAAGAPLAVPVAAGDPERDVREAVGAP
jgi:branched-chain amino acid transport system permease protein